MPDALVGRHEPELCRALADGGKPPQRIVPAVRLDAAQAKDPAGALEYARGLRREFGGARGLRFGMVKVFLDGVGEDPAQTAAPLEPYLDGEGRPTENRGELSTSAADHGLLTAAFNRSGRSLPRRPPGSPPGQAAGRSDADRPKVQVGQTITNGITRPAAPLWELTVGNTRSAYPARSTSHI
ncbi:hypothetical protein BGK67_25445 [Streptomyces subrutilus]|uniref:Uncharacterized protein n=2 Tax=Streptomyces subrutilus TaxID=36818 RepID=A0A1E5PXJ7_9ACTN|nr:hypothetical protein BGK67_25445 [Streptomyces subrutilus]